jgi:DNA adenine methylase
MLIPYLGNKEKFSNFITPYIPTDISTYVEPFAGVFGVFFCLDFTKFKNINFIYNDKNHLNYLLFKHLRDDNDFMDLVRSTNVDKEFYTECLKNIFIEKDERLLALYWLVILNCSSPYKVGEDSWVGSSEFDIFKIKYGAYKYHIDRITEIEKLDYIDVIKKYDSKETFFYVDPPYMGKEKYYINHDFTPESHLELAKVLNNIQGRFLLSYFYFDGMNELYPNCKIEKKITIMGTEYIIMNY